MSTRHPVHLSQQLPDPLWRFAAAVVNYEPARLEALIAYERHWDPAARTRARHRAERVTYEHVAAQPVPPGLTEPEWVAVREYRAFARALVTGALGGVRDPRVLQRYGRTAADPEPDWVPGGTHRDHVRARARTAYVRMHRALARMHDHWSGAGDTNGIPAVTRQLVTLHGLAGGPEADQLSASSVAARGRPAAVVHGWVVTAGIGPGWAFDPVWRTPDTVAIVRGMVTRHEFDAAPVLADALQEAGCTSAVLLAHLRHPETLWYPGCRIFECLLAPG